MLCFSLGSGLKFCRADGCLTSPKVIRSSRPLRQLNGHHRRSRRYVPHGWPVYDTLCHPLTPFRHPRDAVEPRLSLCGCLESISAMSTERKCNKDLADAWGVSLRTVKRRLKRLRAFPTYPVCSRNEWSAEDFEDVIAAHQKLTEKLARKRRKQYA